MLKNTLNLTLEDFQNMVDSACAEIPSKFTDLLTKNNIPIFCVEEIDKTDRENGIMPYGKFIGYPLQKSTHHYIRTEPTRIEMYLETFKKAYFSEPDIRNKVKQVVIHEIAHYMGFNEEEIKQNGY